MSTTTKLSELSEFITCPICQGYLIDATTVNECLHTFCKSCIVKHIKNDQNHCPKCDTVIHEHRPLDYIILDRNKQDIVYKLVPQLYISELRKRTAFGSCDVDPMTRWELNKKFLYIILSYNNTNEFKNKPASSSSRPRNSTSFDDPSPVMTPKPIYLQCQFTVTIKPLRKLIANKFNLKPTDEITFLYRGDIVSDEDQVSNLAQSLTFDINYEISRKLSFNKAIDS